jgi:hypothetical protein
MTVRHSTGFRNRMQGLTYNKATNGEFTSATTGWTASNASLSSVASGQDGNCLQVSETGSASPGQAYQDITVSENKVVHVSFYFKKGTADAGKVMLGTTGSPAAYYDSGALNDAAWAFYETWIRPTNSTLRVTLESTDATADETSLFDTIVVETVEQGWRDIFKNGCIRIFTGSQPSTADAAEQGTLLGVVSESHGTWTAWLAANGLQWAVPDAATIDKLLSQVWQFVGLSDATAGWGRICGNELDSGALSTTAPRVDFSIGSVGTDVTISPSSTIATGGVYTIDSMQDVIPYQAGATS